MNKHEATLLSLSCPSVGHRIAVFTTHTHTHTTDADYLEPKEWAEE